jgi:Ca-activated chloride channel family protein
MLAAEAEASRIHFVSPDPNSVVIGVTEISFVVEPGKPEIDRIDVYVQGRLIGSAMPPGWRFDWDAPSGASGVDLVAVAFAAGTRVENVRLPTFAVPFGDKITVSVVQLYPVVVDRRGRYARDLTKDEFTVVDQGQKVEIESFATEALTLSVAIMLDVSASMFDRLGIVQEASCGFVNSLREGDRVAVYAFNREVREVVALTDDRVRAMKGIRSLKAGGGTALYDAACHVFREVRSVSGRRAVFLFSDGQDEHSIATLQQTIVAARQAESIVYAVGAGDDEASVEARVDLTQLSGETGGDAHFITRLKDLPEVFSRVLSHLRAQYVLSYTAPTGPPGVRSVEVQVSRPGYEVHCRKSYRHGE